MFKNKKGFERHFFVLMAAMVNLIPPRDYFLYACEYVAANQSLECDELCNPSDISQQLQYQVNSVFLRSKFCLGIDWFKHLSITNACFWIYYGTCRAYITNLDFVTYTREKFGAIRYGFFDGNQDVSKDAASNVNIVIANSIVHLTAFESMTVLMLDGHMDDSSIKQLSLLSMPHLHKLSLNRCHISCTGACDLVIMMLKNTVITVLELKGNDIGVRGALALVKLINSNTALTNLSLCNNPLSGVLNIVSYFHHLTLIDNSSNADDDSIRMTCQMETERAALFEDALYRNVILDQFCASPLPITYNLANRAPKRQRLLALMVCAKRMNVFLSDDLWLRSMQSVLAFS